MWWCRDTCQNLKHAFMLVLHRYPNIHKNHVGFVYEVDHGSGLLTTSVMKWISDVYKNNLFIILPKLWKM
jgi:hypothetical protein